MLLTFFIHTGSLQGTRRRPVLPKQLLQKDHRSHRHDRSINYSSMRLFLSFLFLVVLSISGYAQKNKLAQQYFVDAEYEKAATLYEELYEENRRNDYYFDRYLECLMQLERYDEAEKIIRKEIKRNGKAAKLYVSLGTLYERQFMDEKAQQYYREAIEKLPAERVPITKLANAYVALTKYDLAIEAYERGAKLLKDEQVFAYNLGDLYRRKGDSTKMIENYLNSLFDNPGRLSSLKNIFQRYLTEDDLTELQKQLYARIQAEPEAMVFPELLGWLFIQKKDYRNALRQAKTLDRRLTEGGGRVFTLGTIALNARDYETAISAFDYITTEKGPSSSYYIDAKRKALGAKRRQVTENYDYTEESLRLLEAEYVQFLDEFGRSRVTAGIMAELAELEAVYLNDLPRATTILDELVQLPGVNPKMQAEAKLDLGDYYLMQGEIWEATLLYSQVDKAFKDDLLGHEARYRNAKLSYFAADFQWAQSQFDVLKASTSKLIANDALDLSVFIMDNLGLDTTANSLRLYSESELLSFQNRMDESFEKLDSLTTQYPDHTLVDDVLYAKAKLYKKMRQPERAAEMYQKIIEEHAEEIRADNALYELAELYQNQLNDPERAKQLYETLFIDYSGSTYAVEARKRFRALRGDNL